MAPPRGNDRHARGGARARARRCLMRRSPSSSIMRRGETNRRSRCRWKASPRYSARRWSRFARCSITSLR
jgi:hypothetical protein